MNQNLDPANAHPNLNEQSTEDPQNKNIAQVDLNANPDKDEDKPEELKENVEEDEEEKKVKEEIDNIIFKEIEDEIIDEMAQEMQKKENDDNDDYDEDEDKWIPKYKDCPCCYGFVYKCKGDTCATLGQCYCIMKDEIEEDEGKHDVNNNENV